MKMRLQMAVLGLMKRMIIFLKKKEEPCCGAVPGSIVLDSAVLRLVRASIGRGASTSTTSLVFVWCVPLGGFLSSPFSFNTIFFFFFPCFVAFWRLDFFNENKGLFKKDSFHKNPPLFSRSLHSHQSQSCLYSAVLLVAA